MQSVYIFLFVWYNVSIGEENMNNLQLIKMFEMIEKDLLDSIYKTIF